MFQSSPSRQSRKAKFPWQAESEACGPELPRQAIEVTCTPRVRTCKAGGSSVYPPY